MSFTTREQIMAAAKQADRGFSGGPDDDVVIMGESIVGMTAIERFFDIAAASRDVEIAELREQLAAARSGLEAEQKVASQSENEAFRCAYKIAKRNTEVAELRQQLSAFHSAVEHVTEDGCTRRSVVAMPEGWAMVHKDRLHDLEFAEEQLAATDGLSGHIMCEKEPVVWMQSDHLSKFIHHACGAQAALVRCSDHQLMPDFQPLYRARSTK